MTTVPSVKNEYARISGYREGARYCKIDLHTHTPASECSSFTLPGIIEAVLEQKSRQKTKKWYDERYEFITALADGQNPFAQPYRSPSITSRPRLGSQLSLDGGVIRKIAQEWRADIRTFYPSDSETSTEEQREQRDECVDRAFYDLRHYLASLFFPEEYIMRCYIEELQLTALTDHNHPGYIVPRLPELGTWFSRLSAVNDIYATRIRRGDPDGKVRATICARLQRATERLATRFDEESNIPRDVKTQHKDRKKALKKTEERKKHIEERLRYWEDSAHMFQPLTLLPGVEITASDVHLLSIFPPKWYISGRIGSILRSIGIPEEHWGRGFVAAASSSIQDTITLVDEEGGIVVPAHSNSDFKGLLRLFKKGLALTKALEHPSLLSLETIGGTVKAGSPGKRGLDACETLRWLDSGRSRPTRDKTLCFVKGSDAHEVRIELDGTGEDLGARFSYVKMDIRPNDTPEEVFRSLRLALLSGHSRTIEHPVEDGYDYNAPEKTTYRIKKGARERLLQCEIARPTVLGLTVAGKGSYADGLSLRFNPFLNCVVGSGGKSTLVRLLGYGLGVLGFTKGTKPKWLPECVRVYWRMGDKIYCIERRGRHLDPADAETRWMERRVDGRWQKIQSTQPDPMVRIWPSKAVQDREAPLADLESDVIQELTDCLKVTSVEKAGPLLVNQPRDIFDSRELFEAVLSKPYLKCRQIIWSTGSPNVPTALDAEKIIVTCEEKGGRRMSLVCAGDLHEDEIRQQFVDHFEGGRYAFARRATLYAM